MTCKECGGQGFHVAYDYDLPYQVPCESCERDACLESLQKRVVLLERLISHCWVHSGYQNCGRSQMGSELGAVYDEIVNRDPDWDDSL